MNRKTTAYFLLALFVLAFVVPVSAIDLGTFRKLKVNLLQNEVGLTIRGVSSQSANLIECQDSTGSSVFSVSAAGAPTTSGAITLQNGETISNATNGTVEISGVTKAGIVQPASIYNSDGSETLDATMSGKTVVCTKSDGTTTITIPVPAAGTVGVVYEIVQTADRQVDVVCTTADSNGIVADNVATSDKVSLATASHLIGGGIRVIGIQTAASTYKWFATAMSPTEPLTVEAAD